MDMPAKHFVLGLLMLALTASPSPGGEPSKAPPAQIDYGGAVAHDPHYASAQLWSAEQRKGAFAQETWPAGRVLVWATPGKTVRGLAPENPANWLEDGRPATKPIDENTDLVFPDSDQEYLVASPARDPFAVRHLTIGRGAQVRLACADVFGNVWIRAGGSVQGFRKVKGARHTFMRSDNPDPLGLGLHLQITKVPEASIEFLGRFETGDDLNLQSGTMVVGPDSAFFPGDRSIQGIFPEARLVLMSGARFHKRGNQHWGDDIIVAGALLAGTPERPLARDCFLGLSYKDKKGQFPDPGHKRFPMGKAEDRGLVVTQEGRLAVHSVDPTKARLVLGWHGRELASRHSSFSEADWLAFAAKIPHRIDVVLLGEAQFDGVVLQDLHAGGIQLDDPGRRLKWRNVTYGQNNGAEPDGLFAKYTGTTEFNLKG